MKSEQKLASLLKSIDGKSYPAYKSIKGKYQFANFSLIIDRVQGDPFASPSNIRIIMPQSVANIPSEFYQSPIRAVACADYLHRQVAQKTYQLSQSRGSGKSGLITIAKIGQEVLKRTSVSINQQQIEVRLLVGLPAQGRRILGLQAQKLICEDIVKIANQCLRSSNINQQQMQKHIETVEDTVYIRQQLPQRQLVAFVANRSILPRQSGISALPLNKQDAIAFQSPVSLEVEFDCPNRGKIRGMGIPQGVTLIVGGGYHGKSTLLHSLDLGIYDHIPDDGREFVVTNPQAVKIQAEEGRSITKVDISPFINHLPQGQSTIAFETPNASGSTSQSANIIEALEVGAEVLLIDEDTSATNFMIRDARMQKLISKDKEPITPFVDKIKALYSDYGVSTVLVMGGSGDYFEVANCVIAMDSFQPLDVTQRVKEIVTQFPQQRAIESETRFGKLASRTITSHSFRLSKERKRIKLKVRDVDAIMLGREEIDLSSVKQLVESSQLKAIAHSMVYLQAKYLSQSQSLTQTLEQLLEDIEHQGLDILTDLPLPDLACFRVIDLAMTINRLRNLRIN